MSSERESSPRIFDSAEQWTDLDSAEIVIGLVAPIGTDLSCVADDLIDELKRVSYQGVLIRLSRQLRELSRPDIKAILEDVLDDGPADIRMAAYMDAGDKFRELFGKDAVARLAIGAIMAERRELVSRAKAAIPIESVTDDRAPAVIAPVDRFAYVLYQLKRPEEVQCLREVYGPAFILIAVHTPREQRVRNLAERIAQSHHEYQKAKYGPHAETLVLRDEADSQKDVGQNVSDTFHLADVFIDGATPDQRRMGIHRFVELLFGNTFYTPTKDEQGMFHAHAASLRSASLGRQVGAVFATEGGSIVAVGCNEVPKAGGGMYWPRDHGDARDHVLGKDPSDEMKRDVLADILKRLNEAGWLERSRSDRTLSDLMHDALEEGLMNGAHFMNLIEFMRPVHAEMAALCDAAERGASLKGATLYVTAFPCHVCAKHIVAVGVDRVVFIEPYPKSLTVKLYSDSIKLDPPDISSEYVRFVAFVGVAPRRFRDWFMMVNRKDAMGNLIRWDGAKSRARLGDWAPMLDATVFREKLKYNALAVWTGGQSPSVEETNAAERMDG